MNKEIKEKIQDFSEVAVQAGAPMVGELIINSLAGQIIPGAATFVLGWKQKKTERMLLKAIDELQQQIQTINNSLKNLESHQINFIQEIIFPIALNCVENESQEEKIKYIVNGVLTSIENNIKDEDLILSYYDILSKLRIIDIKILMKAYKNYKEDIKYVDKKSDIIINNEYEAIETYTIRKIESLGLISRPKTFAEMDGEFVKISIHEISISKLGIYLVEFFRIFKE